METTDPRKAVEDDGAGADVIGVETGEAQTLVSDIDHGEKPAVEKSFSDVSPDDYDAVVVPNGARRCAVPGRGYPGPGL